MDPDATLRDLLEGVEAGNEEQVSILSQALHDWLENGGFPPKTLGKWKLGQDWHRSLALCICNLAGVHVPVIVSRMQGGDDAAQ